MVDRLVDEAEAANRPVVVVGPPRPANLPARIEAPERRPDHGRRGLVAQPFAPLRDVPQNASSRRLADQSGVSVVWLTDGIDYGKAAAFIEQIARGWRVPISASSRSAMMQHRSALPPASAMAAH